MGLRSELQLILKEILEADYVYFQPPPDFKMTYPCIRYELNDIDIRHANDRPYKHENRYQVMVIDRDPDSIIPKKISMLPSADFDRHYTADNLHHFVFRLFF